MDYTAAFANSALVNTQVVVALPNPVTSTKNFELVVHNPSLVSDLTVKIFNVEKVLGGADRDSLVTTLAVPKKQTITGTLIETYTKTVLGLMFPGKNDAKLVVSNDTVLGVADGFTADIRLREG